MVGQTIIHSCRAHQAARGLQPVFTCRPWSGGLFIRHSTSILLTCDKLERVIHGTLYEVKIYYITLVDICNAGPLYRIGAPQHLADRGERDPTHGTTPVHER